MHAFASLFPQVKICFDGQAAQMSVTVSQDSSSGVLVTVATDQELGWTEIRRISLQIYIDIPSIMINGLPVVQSVCSTNLQNLNRIPC